MLLCCSDVVLMLFPVERMRGLWEQERDCAGDVRGVVHAGGGGRRTQGGRLTGRLLTSWRHNAKYNLV